MPQTRSRQAPEPPRPRRKAASRSPKPSARHPIDSTVWTNASGLSLVGKQITVCWPSDGTYYPALVVGFHPRARKHKLIYLEDESVESVDLGTGPTQRHYNLLPPPDDPLVGKTIEFLPDLKHPQSSWFDFMRGNREKPGQKFNVIVFSKLTSEPLPDEVCSPPPPEGTPIPSQYYRVIYLANEYLATVDLAHVEYRVETPIQPPEDPVMDDLDDRQPPAQRSALPPESQRLAPRPATDEEPPEPPEEQQEDEADDEAYEPPKDQDAVGDSDEEMEDAGRRDDRQLAVKKAPTEDHEPVPPEITAKIHADAKYRASGTKDLVVDATSDETGGKIVSVDRDAGNGFVRTEPGTKVQVTRDDSMNAAPLEISGSKPKGEGSVGTQDTRDDPLDLGTASGKTSKAQRPVPASLFPPLFEDEEGGARDTASEEELPWPSEEKQEPDGESKSQVGDYIQLDLGDGSEPRKAFVEAYLPGLDKHFVAFCDAKGGNLKIKLTSSNHTVLKDEEVHELSRTPIAKEEPASVAARSKRRRHVLTLSDSKAKKKKDIKAPVVKGDSAGAEICGRCLKIVWPGSELVYTALVLGYNPDKKEHLVVYLSDHCVEVLDLKYREWNLLAREDEPWRAQGMLGQRLYVLWSGEYDSEEANKRSEELFGDEAKVLFEAYVLSYEGEDKYLILYPSTEDTEVRDLKIDEKDRDDLRPFEKDWDILEPGVEEVAGLPVIGWEP